MGDTRIIIADLRGGRNGVDAPTDPNFPPTQCVDAVNVDFSRGPLGRRRGGSTSVSLTCSSGGPFASGVQALSRYVPSASETSAELWAVDGTGQLFRLVASTSWAELTAIAVSASFTEFRSLSFNGKLILFYKDATGLDRLKVWDGTTLRHLGLSTPAAPTVQNSAVFGAYPATARYYRVRTIILSGTTVVARSEPSPTSTIFTPDAAHNAAQINNPYASPAGDGATHVELETSTDGLNFNVHSGQVTGAPHAPIAFNISNFLDADLVATYASNPTPDPNGYYQTFPSAKFGVTDGNRLIVAGAFETTSAAFQSRIWFSPVLGSADKGDDERWISTSTQRNWIDLNEKDGGSITALAGPLDGKIYAFKYRQLWRLTPTGDVSTPYLARKISDVIGAVNQASVILAEDATGAPAVYFISVDGPYRLGVNGLEYLGRDVEDYWRGLNGKSAINLAATSGVAHGIYYPSLRQVWWWISTGSNNIPDTKLVFDVKQATRRDAFGVRGGWAVHTGNAAGAYCSVMFANTLGATMSRDLKPYLGRSTGTTLYKTDTTDTDDAGTTFQAYVKTKSILPLSQFGRRTGIRESTLIATAGAAITIRQTIDRDYGLETETADVLLTASASETRVVRKFEAGALSDLGVAQIQLGDTAAVSAASWSLDMLTVPITDQGLK